jgi:ABC-type nitrate/sulfonate/bicarbonate transport system permease component
MMMSLVQLWIALSIGVVLGFALACLLQVSGANAEQLRNRKQQIS